MHYLDERPAQPPVAPCSRGQPAWSYLYRKMIPAFLEAGPRAVAPDVFGFGRSDNAIMALIEALYLQRVTWVCQNILDRVAKAGAGFRSLGDKWADTTTPHGLMMLTVLGGLAKFKRELIRARSGEGRVRAQARGVHMARPPKLTLRQKHEALKALADGTASQTDQARSFNLSSSTISRMVGKAAPSPHPISVKPELDAEAERAARAFLKRLEGKYSIVDAILYGSRARGNHTPESDADIAVILKGERGERRDRTTASLDMAGVAFDVMMETGVMVQGFPLWETELARPETFTNPALINNVLRDGVHL